MKTRELVKSGQLSVDDALASFQQLRNNGEIVKDAIIHWLERRKGTRVAKPSRNKSKKKK